MNLRIAGLQNVTLKTDDEGVYLEMNSFLKTVGERKGPEETHIRRNNFERNNKSYIKVIDNEKYVQLSAIVYHIYANREKYKFYQLLCSQIENRLLTQNVPVRCPTPASKSVLDFYKEVSGFDFGTILQEEIPTSPTLIEVHRDQFSDIEWRKICLAEWHFSHLPGVCDLEYEEQVESRFKFLHTLRNIKDVSKNIKAISKATISRRKQRRSLADNAQLIVYIEERSHKLERIEQDVHAQICKTFSGFDSPLVAVTCSKRCQKRHEIKGIHIYMATENRTEVDMGHICEVTTRVLNRDHNISCISIEFFKEDSFLDYIESGQVSHFHLHDDIVAGKLDHLQVYSWSPPDVERQLDEDPFEPCAACSMEDSTEQPLHWKSFDVEKEWCLDVPLEIQLVFDSFISKTTQNRAKEMTEFLKGKHVRLYALYDNLLNVSNKNHFGIIQEMNTGELMMNYRNIGAAFRLAQSMGFAVSHVNAENQWKSRGTGDAAYYNYAIRRMPLKYESPAGTDIHYVSLRECYKIAMRDNLVTLTEKANPIPGESRTGQICTIQGTDIGIPKDMVQLENFHDPQVCDGSATCICMTPINLKKENFRDYLLDMSPEEQAARAKCDSLCIWGLQKIWKAIIADDNFLTLLSAVEEQVDVPDLVAGMLDMSLDDIILGGDIDPLDIADYDEDLSSVMSAIDNISTYPLGESSSQPPDYVVIDSDSDLDITFDGAHAMVEDTQDEEDLAHSVGFTRYIPPPFIVRHTLPWVGRDDDPKKIAEILSDLITMTDAEDDFCILGVDQKIGACHVKLERSHPHFKNIIREFPVLHLQKMKIVNFSSAYKGAGLLLILKYMANNDKEDDLNKLLGISNIRKATRLIRRVALAFSIAFMVAFIRHLPFIHARSLLDDLTMQSPSALEDTWGGQYTRFLEQGCETNATFALHYDMMKHAFEIIGIYLAERIGGPAGYHLLRACTKTSLLFSFTNGASSYAAYTTRLLLDHCRAPPFFQHLKMSYFSVPYEDSGVNYGLDTVREEDHRKCKKFFRPGSSSNSIIQRMHLMDEALEMQERHTECLHGPSKDLQEDHSNWVITDKDVQFVLRGASLILQQGGVNVTEDAQPYNVYTRTPEPLPEAILDSYAESSGEYLLLKYCKEEGLLDISQTELNEKKQNLTGSKELIRKVTTGKSTTVNRNRCHPTASKTREEKEADAKSRKLQQDKKKLESLHSDQNTCQAIVDPRCLKYKVMKSVTVPRAIIAATGVCLTNKEAPLDDLESSCLNLKSPDVVHLEQAVKEAGLIQCGINYLPDGLGQRIKVVTVENAGVPFKADKKLMSGVEYLRQVDDKWISPTLTQASSLKVMAICEEKYDFTPDLFKSATRSQRTKSAGAKTSIAHLKIGDEAISDSTFNRESVTTTTDGKQLISKYIAANVNRLDIKRNVRIIVDSELYTQRCNCSKIKGTECSCKRYTLPVQCNFTDKGLQDTQLLHHIKQRKGEAECSQVDWLLELQKHLGDRDAALALVTSSDIDAVVLHLFAISQHWPRHPDGTFCNSVYVKLQKAGYFDLYNITGLLELLEASFQTRQIGVWFALALCIGGNDFLPKFQQVPHLRIIQLFLGKREFRENLFLLEHDQHGICTSGKVNIQVYKSLLKHLYCPKTLCADSLSYEEVRQLSIKSSNMRKNSLDTETFSFVDGQAELRHPRFWLPPESCLSRISTLIDAMIEYLLTLGKHDADLPDFSKTCLVQSGKKLVYDLGPEAHVSRLADLLPLSSETLCAKTTSAKKTAKRQLEVTPTKRMPRKRRPVTSTPKKLQ